MANPDTCRHNILAADIQRTASLADAKVVIYCVSCDSEVPYHMRFGKRYEYDIDNNVYVYVPVSRMERPQAPGDPED